MIDLLVAILAIAANLLQFILIVKGKVKVPRVSWIIWFVIIAFSFVINLFFNGWDTATISLGSFTLGNLFIASYVLLKNPGGWVKREKQLLGLALIIMILWIPFKVVEYEESLLCATIVSLILLRAIHVIGVWEYWMKIWKDPFTEAIVPWFLRWGSALIASTHIITTQELFLSKERMYISFSQPLYLWLAVSVTLILIILQRRRLKRS